MRTDIKIYQGTNEIKVMSANAARAINKWCNLAFVKGNSRYKIPDDLHIPEGMCKNLIFHLLIGQNELTVKVVPIESEDHPNNPIYTK